MTPKPDLGVGKDRSAARHRVFTLWASVKGDPGPWMIAVAAPRVFQAKGCAVSGHEIRSGASQRVAALYVETGGVYFGLPDVDPWDEARDARLYAGPWPVVAHPPCTRWSILGLCRGYGDGEDGGCFAAALEAVRTYGGVLEHPRYSLAWRRFGLPHPVSGGWVRSLDDDGWTTEVDQANYGHEGRKPTWLYYIGDTPPPPLRWGPVDKDVPRLRDLPGRGNGFWRSRTPVAFRDELFSIARSAQREGCVHAA